MTEKFAIAVRWPDDPRPYLVHLHKPYFVAEAKQSGGVVFFFASLSTEQIRACSDRLQALLQDATEFFRASLGLHIREAHFIKGNHGHEFPRFLMAKTSRGDTYIVEPDQPAPLVEVREPRADEAPRRKSHVRFDVVMQWRLAEMRKYYQQFIERQQTGACTALVVPTLG